MVEVDSETSQRVDFSLEYLQREWADVPNIAQEFGEWEPIDQTAFELEWAIRESHLQRLQTWAREGRLSESQQARYERLLTLIDEQRPTLERMFAH